MGTREDKEYEAWLKEVESTLSADGMAKFKEVLAEDKARQIFKGPLRESDYYRRLEDINKAKKEALDEVESQKAQLNTWFAQEKPKNEALLKEKARLEAELRRSLERRKDLGDEDVDDLPANTPSFTGVDKDEVDQLRNQLAQMGQVLPRALSDIAEVTYRISKEKFDISPRDVIEHSFKHNVDPLTALDTLTADERTKRERDRMAELEKKWKEEGRREALTNSAPPDLMRHSMPDSVARLFSSPDQKETPEFGSGAAVAEFRKMVSDGTL